MDLSQYIDIPIAVIVYLIIELLKRLVVKTDKQRSMLPIIALIIGSFISILIFYIWPNLSTNVNVLNAFASGAISGTAATGSNQIYKQIVKFFTVDNYN